ncbi:unnamed protein product [Leptosia nina]|uniref:Dihydrodipicolinate synthase family protein n=1 Tax=Leptosia nina TaxID=320188 RepID=A0AAV1JM20_9NEOP
MLKYWQPITSKEASFDFHGLVAPVFTPLYEDGEINYDVIPKYAKYLVMQNVTGILVGGTTGEFASLNMKERNALLDAWLEIT